MPKLAILINVDEWIIYAVAITVTSLHFPASQLRGQTFPKTISKNLTSFYQCDSKVKHKLFMQNKKRRFFYPFFKK